MTAEGAEAWVISLPVDGDRARHVIALVVEALEDAGIAVEVAPKDALAGLANGTAKIGEVRAIARIAAGDPVMIGRVDD